MKIREGLYALPMEAAFIQLLTQETIQFQKDSASSMTVLNFRDPQYSAQRGGYHPVEVGIGKEGSIMYITEFSFAGGGDMAELAKEVDFDLLSGVFQHFDRVHPIEDGIELFGVWQQNFCHYAQSGIYDVSVSQH